MVACDIASVSNPRIKAAVKLRDSAKERREKGMFFLEGLRLCRDAARSGIIADTVFYTKNFQVEHSEALSEIIENVQNVFSVSDEVMQKLSDTVNPQGVVSICAIPQFVDEVSDGLYIGLEKTADPTNLGAIARSAEAFGVKGIYISADSCDPYSPKSLRAGMGALLRLPIFRLQSFFEDMEKQMQKGATLYASVVDGSATDVRSITPSGKSILLIGNEANGLSEQITKISKPITIKMSGRAESLNAAAAAAILIFELTRGAK